MYDNQDKIYTILKLLRKIRKTQNIKQTDISKKIGISRQMISKMEQYDGNPKLSTLVKYCESINVDLEKAILEYYERNIRN